MIFLDTSIFVAAAQTRHLNHERSLALLRAAGRDTAACALHSLAETYSVLSGMPKPHRVPAKAALQIIEQITERVRVISLSEAEYMETLRRIQAQGLIGGIIYDALLMRCAKKVEVTQIYSLNGKDLKLIDPDLAHLVSEP